VSDTDEEDTAVTDSKLFVTVEKVILLVMGLSELSETLFLVFYW